MCVYIYIFIHTYNICVYPRAHWQTLIFNKKVGQGIQTQKRKAQPSVLNFCRLHHLDLLFVMGGLITGADTTELNPF